MNIVLFLIERLISIASLGVSIWALIMTYKVNANAKTAREAADEARKMLLKRVQNAEKFDLLHGLKSDIKDLVSKFQNMQYNIRSGQQTYIFTNIKKLDKLLSDIDQSPSLYSDKNIRQARDEIKNEKIKLLDCYDSSKNDNNLILKNNYFLL